MSIQFGLLKSCLLITSHREIISPLYCGFGVPQVVERVVPHVHYSLKHTLTPAPLGSGGAVMMVIRTLYSMM